MARSAQDVLDGLDAAQREVAVTLKGPVVVLAGAGSGKTRAITHRIAHAAITGVHDPRRTLAVTFTNRAAGEMRSRLAALGVQGVQARTFHSAGLRQLHYFWPKVFPGQAPALLDRKAPLVAEAAASLGLSTEATIVRDLASEIEWSKSVLLSAQDYATSAHMRGRVAPSGLTFVDVAKVMSLYAELLSSRRLMDFEEVLLLLLALLVEEPALADEVRTQYRHFTVDEYQDVNPVQQKLLETWLGDNNDICVVGDAAQTIYTFAGASSQYLQGFERKFKGATVITLDQCYRCTPQIVSLANQVVPRSSRIVLKSQRKAGPKPELHAFDNEVAEAEAIAARIKALMGEGVNPRDIAVLYRINAQSEVFEDALTNYDVPYIVRGGEKFFDRPEVKQALVLLRGARAGGVETSIPLTDQVRAALTPLNVPLVAPDGRGAARDRWESVAALFALVDDIVAAEPQSTLDDLVRTLEDRSAAQHAPMPYGVTLATFHSAKGLEWKYVFVAGLVDGTVPISYATTQEMVEEEKRLLYVAITRAADELWLSWSRARTPGQRPTRERSRFLHGLDLSVLEISGDPTLKE